MNFREYELIYILSPEIEEEKVDDLNRKIDDFLRERGGGVINFRDMGTKKLAYKIKNQMKGRYFYLDYYGSGMIPRDLENILRYYPYTLRYMTVKINDNIDPLKRIEEAKSIAKEEIFDIETFSSDLVPEEESDEDLDISANESLVHEEEDIEDEESGGEVRDPELDDGSEEKDED